MAYTPKTMKVVLWSLLIIDDNDACAAGINEHPFALVRDHIPNWPSLSWTLEIDPEGKLSSIGTYDSAGFLSYKLLRHETEVEVTIYTPGDS